MRLGDLAYLREARKIAAAVFSRSRKQGGYSLGWKKAPYLASFHRGMAGIGYEYLRLAAPPSLPSLLLWEWSTKVHRSDAASDLRLASSCFRFLLYSELIIRDRTARGSFCGKIAEKLILTRRFTQTRLR
jgi:hypothetical protein